ncbi:hypothetical protein YC2023_037052 [Brassica napus]
MENLRLAASPVFLEFDGGPCLESDRSGDETVVFKLDSSVLNNEMEVGGSVGVTLLCRYGPWCLGFERRGARDWACGACLPLLEGSDIPNLAK